MLIPKKTLKAGVTMAFQSERISDVTDCLASKTPIFTVEIHYYLHKKDSAPSTTATMPNIDITNISRENFVQLTINALRLAGETTQLEQQVVFKLQWESKQKETSILIIATDRQWAVVMAKLCRQHQDVVDGLLVASFDQEDLLCYIMSRTLVE
jgi:hypothetical protein